MDKISVIIPAYNAENFISEAIDSVKIQVIPDNIKIDITVVDDGSTDGTSSAAKAAGAAVITQKHSGAASARNLGVQQSFGNLVMFLDADDVLTPGAIAALCDGLLADADEIAANDAVFANAVEFFTPELAAESDGSVSARKHPYSGTLPGCSLIRRHVFDKIGTFDETLLSGETVDWMIRLKRSDCAVKQIGFVTLKRRIHSSNTGRTDRCGEMKNYAAILRAKMKKSSN